MSKRSLCAVITAAVCAVLSACTEAPAEPVSESSTAESASITASAEKENTSPDEVTTADEMTAEEAVLTEIEEFITEDTEHTLTASQTFVKADDENGFYFMLKPDHELSDKDTAVGLYDSDDTLITDMTDDGTGIYSCYFKPDTDGWKTFNVYALYDGQKSNTVRVRTYTDEILTEDSEDFKKIVDEFSDISEKYTNLFGEYSDENKVKAFSEACALAEKLYNEERVIELRISPENSSITLKALNGTTYVFATEKMT